MSNKHSNKKEKVFLGGTCNGSQWRNAAEQQLKIPYFNPVVDDWDEQAMAREEQEKEQSRVHLYVLTPKMKGCFAVAELIHDCHLPDTDTYFCYLTEDDGHRFDAHQEKSMKAVAKLARSLGAVYRPTLDELLVEINKRNA